MKKRLLFVIDSLTIGGAEKSLVSLLNMLNSSNYEIDLLLFKKGGDLEKYLPKFVNILPLPDYFVFLNGGKYSLLKTFIYFKYRIKTSILLRINKFGRRFLHGEQVVFKSIKKVLNPIEKDYDVAIAYNQGMPTYFVANKVKATKKLAWINTDYVNASYNKDVDFESYKKIDQIIAVSHYIKDSVSKLRKEYNSKVEVILDIVDPEMIYKMSSEFNVDEFKQPLVNILTVGRLVNVKSYETAIDVARQLKNSGYKFKWFGIGEGPERKKLQSLIDEYGINDCFELLGKKINPYPYMKNCNIYVQTSKKEGFGLTVCEAKILKRPIVCANFPTAKEIINNEVDGLLVEHGIDSIYKGITKYLEDNSFLNKITKELNVQEPYSS
ncbi:glycosyltransferase, partial [Neobacillus drentensis]|uniref:glycosyltransferase n=1 Tax=Neobacillus drentensis TaxID=220684 RepID=UPI003003551A